MKNKTQPKGEKIVISLGYSQNQIKIGNKSFDEILTEMSEFSSKAIEAGKKIYSPYTPRPQLQTNHHFSNFKPKHYTPPHFTTNINHKTRYPVPVTELHSNKLHSFDTKYFRECACYAFFLRDNYSGAFYIKYFKKVTIQNILRFLSAAWNKDKQTGLPYDFCGLPENLYVDNIKDFQIFKNLLRRLGVNLVSPYPGSRVGGALERLMYIWKTSFEVRQIEKNLDALNEKAAAFAQQINGEWLIKTGKRENITRFEKYLNGFKEEKRTAPDLLSIKEYLFVEYMIGNINHNQFKCLSADSFMDAAKRSLLNKGIISNRIAGLKGFTPQGIKNNLSRDQVDQYVTHMKKNFPDEMDLWYWLNQYKAIKEAGRNDAVEELEKFFLKENGEPIENTLKELENEI